MINRTAIWIKNHKFSTVLLILVLYLIFAKNFSTVKLPFYNSYSDDMSYKTMALPQAGMMERSIGGYSESAPAPDVTERMVVQNSNLSLLVKNVSETLRSIKQNAESFGGYMVDSSLSDPSENGSGNLTLRIPANRLETFLGEVKNLAVKVVSENLQGTDVTDQYVDIETRIKILEGNKARFEQLMTEAREISDILNIQQQIMNLQSQIDSYKGQQNYLEKTAEMAKVTIYLSTDEYELPYAPSEPWRPEVIFKEAIRSLVGNLRNLGTFIIWVAVYTILIIPILALVYFIRKRKKDFSSPHN